MKDRPEQHQENLYTFPYHWIPYRRGESAYIHRFLWWGLRYLTLLEQVKTEVLASQPRRLLDFGCGDGRLCGELAAHVPHIVGYDISDAALAFARAFVTAPNVTFTAAITDLANQQFDVAAAMEVLEHLPPDETPQILTQLSNLLPSGSTFVLSTPTWNAPVSAKHYRHFSADELTKLLRPWFSISTLQYVHKPGVADRLLRLISVNRLFVANWRPWLRLVHKLYGRYVAPADAATGLHIQATCHRL